MSVQANASSDRAQQILPERPSLAAQNIRLFMQNPGAVAGLVYMVVITLLVILAPLVTPYDFEEIDIRAIRKPPSVVHLLGTDNTGRDLYTRILYGGRVSLLIGLSAVIIRTAIGLVMGAISGFFGGAVDFLIQRFVDVMLTIPQIFLLLILVGAYGPSPLVLLIGLGLLGWFPDTRIFRGQVLSIRELDYTLAARSIGRSNWGIVQKHVLPNVMHLVLVNMTLNIGAIIIAEAGLSFLGLGVQQPTPSWGNIIQEANQVTRIRQFWWFWIPPGTVLVLTVISLNLIGDALRDILDPRRRR
ncbi:MAG: ABC transporter permease [Caldilineaceae bacterium]|nr:ABC transporter permease [Caldilineaceae bacterium]MDE0069985.1 ABC transporter permease [Caldilineaceae bacterium]